MNKKENIKKLEQIKYYSEQLLAAIERNKRRYINRRLRQLTAVNGTLAEESTQEDILAMTEKIGAEITRIEENLNNPTDCLKYAGVIVKMISEHREETNFYDKPSIPWKTVDQIHSILSSSSERLLLISTESLQNTINYAQSINLKTFFHGTRAFTDHIVPATSKPSITGDEAPWMNLGRKPIDKFGFHLDKKPIFISNSIYSSGFFVKNSGQIFEINHKKYEKRFYEKQEARFKVPSRIIGEVTHDYLHGDPEGAFQKYFNHLELFKKLKKDVREEFHFFHELYFNNRTIKSVFLPIKPNKRNEILKRLEFFKNLGLGKKRVYFYYDFGGLFFTYVVDEHHQRDYTGINLGAAIPTAYIENAQKPINDKLGNLWQMFDKENKKHKGKSAFFL
tara:strand:+ start:91 stop:1269 length:1179 start_codon:yes stop_codon:yes gene_type:complete